MTITKPDRKRTTASKDAAKQARKEPRFAQRAAAKAASKTKSPASTPSRRQDRSAIRQGSKTEKIIGLLKRPDGATLNEVMKATEWQAHSVRGFLSGTLRKKLGVRVDSIKRDDNERTYRISSK